MHALIQKTKSLPPSPTSIGLGFDNTDRNTAIACGVGVIAAAGLAFYLIKR
jgi:hypothetical protein